MAKTYSMLVGAALLLVGIVGFMRTELMGLMFSTEHNVIHLASGIVGLLCAFAGDKASRLFAQVFGVIYTLVAIVGFAHIAENLTAPLHLNTAYNVIHLAVGVLGLAAGFMGGKQA